MRLRAVLVFAIVLGIPFTYAAAEDRGPVLPGQPYLIPAGTIDAPKPGPLPPVTLPALAPSTTPTPPVMDGPVKRTTDCVFDIPPDTVSGTGHVVAGAGFLLVQPRFEGNGAFFVVRQPTQTGSTATNRVNIFRTEQVDFGPDVQFAPLVWLGYAGPGGLGARGRWWQFDQSSRTGTDLPAQTSAGETIFVGSIPTTLGGTVSNATGPQQIRASSALKLNVWDVEVTQDLPAGTWTLMVSGGVRYAHVAQRFRSTLVETAAATTTSTDTFGHSFNGAGPVLALEVHRPLGETGLSLFGNARGTVLFGGGKSFAATQEVQRTATTSVTTFNDALGSQDDILPVGELEVGLEYARAVGRLYLFSQTGLVGQLWQGAGNATSENGNLGFVGLSLRAGVGY